MRADLVKLAAKRSLNQGSSPAISDNELEEVERERELCSSTGFVVNYSENLSEVEIKCPAPPDRGGNFR